MSTLTTEYAVGDRVEVIGSGWEYSWAAGFQAVVGVDPDPNDGPRDDEDIFLVPTDPDDVRARNVPGGFYWISRDVKRVEESK